MEARTVAPVEAVPLSLEALYEAYGDMIYRLALQRTRNRADAEDVLQDVFFRCLRRAPVFESREHQKAWLIRVALNSSKTLLGSAFMRHRADESALELLPAGTEPEVSAVYEQVLKLPEKQRIAIHLFYYEGYGVADIATLMNCPESTVKSHLRRARLRLKEALKEEVEGGDWDV